MPHRNRRNQTSQRQEDENFDNKIGGDNDVKKKTENGEDENKRDIFDENDEAVNDDYDDYVSI
jgi:hypothetical protein